MLIFTFVFRSSKASGGNSRRLFLGMMRILSRAGIRNSGSISDFVFFGIQFLLLSFRKARMKDLRPLPADGVDDVQEPAFSGKPNHKKPVFVFRVFLVPRFD